MDQGPMHNSGIDIPKRKDKEDLTESSEVVALHFEITFIFENLEYRKMCCCVAVFLSVCVPPCPHYFIFFFFIFKTVFPKES